MRGDCQWRRTSEQIAVKAEANVKVLPHCRGRQANTDRNVGGPCARPRPYTSGGYACSSVRSRSLARLDGFNASQLAFYRKQKEGRVNSCARTAQKKRGREREQKKQKRREKSESRVEKNCHYVAPLKRGGRNDARTKKKEKKRGVLKERCMRGVTEKDQTYSHLLISAPSAAWPYPSAPGVLAVELLPDRLDALVLGRTLLPYIPWELCGCAPLPW